MKSYIEETNKRAQSDETILDQGKETDEQRQARTGLMSAKLVDDAAKAVQKTPNRISLEFMESQVASEVYIHPENLPHATICVLVLKNGFALIGDSVPADPGNYNEELGRKFSRDQAIKKAWPLFAFALRNEMSGITVQDQLTKE